MRAAAAVSIMIFIRNSPDIARHQVNDEHVGVFNRAHVYAKPYVAADDGYLPEVIRPDFMLLGSSTGTSHADLRDGCCVQRRTKTRDWIELLRPQRGAAAGK